MTSVVNFRLTKDNVYPCVYRSLGVVPSPPPDSSLFGSQNRFTRTPERRKRTRVLGSRLDESVARLHVSLSSQKSTTRVSGTKHLGPGNITFEGSQQGSGSPGNSIYNKESYYFLNLIGALYITILPSRKRNSLEQRTGQRLTCSVWGHLGDIPESLGDSRDNE